MCVQLTGNQVIQPDEQTPSEKITKLWTLAVDDDKDFQRMMQAVANGERQVPSGLSRPSKVSISDCSLSENGELLYRERRWVPFSEPLRTTILQSLHDSVATLHPGKNGMISLFVREFFWPNYIQDITRFVRNCDVCG